MNYLPRQSITAVQYRPEHVSDVFNAFGTKGLHVDDRGNLVIVRGDELEYAHLDDYIWGIMSPDEPFERIAGPFVMSAYDFNKLFKPVEER